MPGAFRHVKMVDGTTVKAFIHGDEFFNYETDENEFLLTPNDKGLYVNTRRRISAEEVQQRRAAARRAPGVTDVTDSPRLRITEEAVKIPILVLMVQFKDVQFRTSREAVDSMFNYNGYNYMGAPGSVYNYFYDQSGGKLQLEFDVVGPVTVDYKSTNVKDNEIDILLEACRKVDNQVDFRKYTLGTDVVFLPFMLCAGEGAASGGHENSLWPHYRSFTPLVPDYIFDDKAIANYASANEIQEFGYSNYHRMGLYRMGIGTICHELSHGLGLPDYYDTNKIGTTNMPMSWSLMGSGCWNNDGITPPNYSIYDKYYMGFDIPGLLNDVQGSTPELRLEASKSGYCINRNNNMPAPTSPHTVYYIENRQKEGWDKHVEGDKHGLVIWKVWYNKKAWEENRVNSTRGEEERVTIITSREKVPNWPFPGEQKSIRLYNTMLGPIKEEDGIITIGLPSVDLYATPERIGMYLKNVDTFSVESEENMDFIMKLYGNNQTEFEFQHATHRYGGSYSDFQTLTQGCRTQEQVLDGVKWYRSVKMNGDEYKHCDTVKYRVKVTTTTNNKKKVFYSDTIVVALKYPFSLTRKYPNGVEHVIKKDAFSPGEEVSYELELDCYDLSVQCAEPIAFEKKDGNLVFTMPACPVNMEIKYGNSYPLVIFYDWDGTKIKTESVMCGEDAEAPTPPTHPGFVFTGWDRDFTNVHSDLKVYATYARPEGRDTYEMELAEHLCENYPYAGTYTVRNSNYKFEGSKTRAMVKDKLTFRLKHTATDAGTVYFWWTADFDEDGDPVWHTGTKVAELTTEEALADKEVLYSYWVCNNPQAYSDEKTYTEKIAFKFRYVDKNLDMLFDTKPMVFDIYYPQFLKFKHSDLLLAAVSSGDNRYTLKLPSNGEQVGDYVYGMVPARYTDTVFLYGTDAYNTDDCLEFQRLRNKSWTYVNTDVTADGTVCYVPEGFTDTILISKNVYPVHFTYRKSDGEGGYYSYEDVQYIPCGSSAVMPSLEEIEYDPVYHPFTEWLCENKPDDRRWMNVREELYYGAYYDYIPNPGQYTVTFVSWEDQLLEEQTVAKFEDAVPPTPPTREGYHFIRWDGDYTFVTEDRRIRAVYGQDDVYWTVSFYNDGWYSDLLGTEQVADGEKAVGNVEVYMDDHVFIGWDKPLDEIHSDLNVAAQYEWREMEHHKVTIIAEHGTVTIRPRQVNPDFVNHGTVLFLEAVPDDGYKLSGWEGYSVQFGLAVTQDTTVTALFTPNTPTALEDNVTDIDSSPQKLLRNGILYILVGDRLYDATGRRVE